MRLLYGRLTAAWNLLYGLLGGMTLPTLRRTLKTADVKYQESNKPGVSAASRMRQVNRRLADILLRVALGSAISDDDANWLKHVRDGNLKHVQRAG